jgi:hypothetical protein
MTNSPPPTRRTRAGRSFGRRPVFHEAAVWDRFPTTTYDDGLHVAEVSRAGGP